MAETAQLLTKYTSCKASQICNKARTLRCQSVATGLVQGSRWPLTLPAAWLVHYAGVGSNNQPLSPIPPPLPPPPRSPIRAGRMDEYVPARSECAVVAQMSVTFVFPIASKAKEADSNPEARQCFLCIPASHCLPPSTRA